MLPGSAQERHVPVQAVPQQIPSSQKPELHSAALPQVAPIGFLPQLPALQLVGATQSASPAQMTMHLALLPQVNGAHDCAAGATHAPSPSQRDAACSIVPVQVCDAQTVPEGYLLHAPVPSQTPSVPQLCGPVSSHSLRGSVPRSANMHVPTAPCRAQLRQTSVQALSQQTPSTQNPLAQSAASRHDVPIDCRAPMSAPEPSPPGLSFEDPSAAPAPVSIAASRPASPSPGLAPPPPHDTTNTASVPTSSVRTSMAPRPIVSADRRARTVPRLLSGNVFATATRHPIDRGLSGKVVSTRGPQDHCPDAPIPVTESAAIRPGALFVVRGRFAGNLDLRRQCARGR